MRHELIRAKEATQNLSNYSQPTEVTQSRDRHSMSSLVRRCGSRLDEMHLRAVEERHETEGVGGQLTDLLIGPVLSRQRLQQ